MASSPPLVSRIPDDAFPEGSHALPRSSSPCPANTLWHPGPCCTGRVSAGASPHPLERATRAALWRWPLRCCHHHSPALGCHRFPPVHLRAGARGHHPPAPAGRRGRLAGARSYRCHRHRLPPGYLCACGLGCHHAEKVLCLLNAIKDTSGTTTSPSPPLHCSCATPQGETLPRMWQRAPQPLLGSKAAPQSALCSYHVVSWAHGDLAGPHHSRQGHPCSSQPSGSALGGGNSVGHQPCTAFLGEGWLFSGYQPPRHCPGLTPTGMFKPLLPPPCLCWAGFPPTSPAGEEESGGFWGGRKKTEACCFGAGSLSYISSHGEEKKKTTRSSPQFVEAARRGPGGLQPDVGLGGGLQPILVGPRPGPVQHWRPLKGRQACRAGSEGITLGAMWCPKTARPVPGGFGVLKSQWQSEKGQGESRGLASGWWGRCHGSPEPLSPWRNAMRNCCPGTGGPGSAPTSERAVSGTLKGAFLCCEGHPR